MTNHTKSGKAKYQKGFWGTVFLLLLFLNPMKSYAGDIPETLLLRDYPVYFGEVKSIDEDTITIIQIENIKGKFQKNSEITYADYIFTDSPNIGQIYLCGYADEAQEKLMAKQNVKKAFKRFPASVEAALK